MMEAGGREPRPEGKMAPALLHDLAARLSEEDWTLLREWQTELYEVVMKELQQALTSLGPVIASSIFALRPKEKPDLFCAERQDSESQSSGAPSPGPVIASSIFALRPKEKPDLFCAERQDSESQSSGAPSPEGDSATSDDGNTDQQPEEGQHSPEQGHQQSTSAEEQPQPPEEADMSGPPSECVQLRHPSSLLHLRIEDGILAKLLIVQPGKIKSQIRCSVEGVACPAEGAAQSPSWVRKDGAEKEKKLVTLRCVLRRTQRAKIYLKK
ncbi:uncharacterized protein LOC144826180 [Lissotriton helveticus]